MNVVKKKKQTQAEKSAAMRLKLCEATLEALTEVGFEKLTTQLACSKAGVSRGAMTHHFSSRNALIAAAFGHLLMQWKTAREEYLASLGAGQTISFSEYTEYLWCNVFALPSYVAALELMLAARKDDVLGRELRNILAGWLDERDFLSTRIIGVDPEDEEIVQFLRLNLCMLRGIAIHGGFNDDEEERERLVATWKNFLLANADRLPRAES